MNSVKIFKTKTFSFSPPGYRTRIREVTVKKKRLILKWDFREQNNFEASWPKGTQQADTQGRNYEWILQENVAVRLARRQRM